jgi:hypothetical protein
MQEERKMILEMLSEKKITAEEAAELLRALGPAVAPPAPQAPASPPFQPTGAAGVSGPAGPAAPAGPVTGDTADHSRSILEDFLSKIDIDWSSLPFAFGGEPYRFEEQHEGEFADGDGAIELDLLARNGRVEVFGWDNPGWQAVVRKKVRASSEQRAREQAADVSTFTSDPKRLFFEEKPSTSLGWGNHGVSIELHVPRDRTYNVNARSSNGRVVVEGLRCLQFLAKTSNGKVVARAVEGKDLEAATANGSILFEGAGARIECRTANGSVTFCPHGGQDTMANLHTANGSIRVKIAPDPDAGYFIEARTGFGGLEVDLPDFEVKEREKQFGRRYLVGKTTGFDGKSRKVEVHARTTNGSVRVNTIHPSELYTLGRTPGQEADEPQQ